MTPREVPINSAVKRTAAFSGVLIIAAICIFVGGLVAGDTLLIIFGVIAALCGVVLAVLSTLARRKIRFRKDD
ncbi:hypothetical protein [Streptomyces sp. NRRL F-5630]|uniref:hypothetical protein n=1 Tax=Streptomyces sp. NRRL F-5630 TaxID=1463864 RepID=UPI00131A9492|nr:hypothetical protein [Streptomyces sp. NRRL F-5630]